MAALLLAAGCSGPAAAPSLPGTGSSVPARLLSPEEFAAETAGGDRFVINVHIPDEGTIAGTDAKIPFDQIEQQGDELPRDRDAPLAVYCRTGTMSKVATATLAGMGYTDVVELRGGMVAWEAAGQSLLPPERIGG